MEEIMSEVAESISEFVNSALSLSIEEIVIQVVATLLLFIVIKIFFWNNITAYLEKRKEIMSEDLLLSKQSTEAAAELKEVAELELNNVRVSAKGMIDDAKERGEVERVKIIGKAKNDASKIMDTAKKDMDIEIEKARTNINDEIVSVAILIAEKVIKKEIDKDKHKELVKQITNEVAT